MALFLMVLLAWFLGDSAVGSLTVCKFPPSLLGQWRGTGWRDLDIDASTIGPITVEGKPYTFSCYSMQDNFYIIKSPDVSFGGKQLNHYTCMRLLKSPSSDDVYYYYIETEPNYDRGNASVVTIETGQINIAKTVCNKANKTLPSDYDILFRKGAENNISAFSCPQQLQARFQGNFSNLSSQRSCPNGFTLDGCSNSSILSFNYTDCGRGNSYSGSVDYLCIFTLYEGGFNYTTVYQPAAGNETNPYIPFSCMNQTEAEGRLSVRVSADKCGGSTHQDLILVNKEICSEILTPQAPTTENMTTERLGNPTLIPQITGAGGDESSGSSICGMNTAILSLILPTVVCIMKTIA
ncbi:uncharacterized protein LOC112563360 isoform X2 [Pomacea canaliculata]|uniref:uncharacterized protein LOC112563360 isoform X2 n=1 Tax=Pomacea canaliculata TaxID=400727 RepID=UPI000D73A212|nr:uncharacterized protein LOC112563360 isoform X2 [Pomacea canaliculata]